MLSIAAFTFREARRRRVFAAVGFLSAAFLTLYALLVRLVEAHSGAGPLSPQALGGAVALFGVYMARSFSGLLAILVSAGAIAGEIESGALQSVLARPLPRAAVVVGKFAGLGALLCVYTAALQGAVLVLARVLAGARVPDPLPVLAWLCLEPLILLSLTLLGSTFLPTVANGAACVLLYGLAVAGGSLEQIGVFLGRTGLQNIGTVTALLLPADAPYRQAFAIASRGVAGAVTDLLGPVLASPARPDAALLLYAALYPCALLAIAIWVFSRRDV